MSSESTDTQFYFSITDNYLNSASHSFEAAAGFDETFMIQLAAALNGLTWPEGCTWNITKNVIDTTSYTPDYTQDPPVFD